MQQPVARFQIQDVIGGQQLHAAAHLQGNLPAAPAADTLQRAVQLCAELVVADGLEHKIQRIDLIAAYGILRHIRHKNQHHIGVQQPDALRRGHAAQRGHLNIEKNNIKPGAVRLHDLGAVRKGGHFQQLAALLRELCKLDFHWILLHYLYPYDITDELVDTIAQEEKIVPYLAIPIQHCNDDILKAMNRRDTKESIRKVFHDLRARIPGLVLRTSIIAGLPGEGEKEFEELCDFLREEKIERAGVFPFSPEEGTKAATMEHVPMEEAQRRTELLVDVQSDIIDEYNESVLGDVREVLCEGWSEESQSYVGRSYAESVDIDGKIYFSAERDIMAGEFVNVRLTGTMDGELTGEAVE